MNENRLIFQEYHFSPIHPPKYTTLILLKGVVLNFECCHFYCVNDMQVSYQHKNRGQYLQNAIKGVLVLLVLLVYLVIPFKQQFLDCVHLASHVILYEKPHHSHDHIDAETNHHHSYLAFLNQALNGKDTEHQIPVELVHYESQTHLPSGGFHLAEHIPFLFDKMRHLFLIHIIAGPFFEVSTPPP